MKPKVGETVTVTYLGPRQGASGNAYKNYAATAPDRPEFVPDWSSMSDEEDRQLAGGCRGCLMATATLERGRAFVPSPVLDEAARLVRKVNVIPIGSDKRPRIKWKKWQTERQYDLPNGEDDAFLLANFGPNVRSLAAITGAISGSWSSTPTAAPRGQRS